MKISNRLLDIDATINKLEISFVLQNKSTAPIIALQSEFTTRAVTQQWKKYNEPKTTHKVNKKIQNTVIEKDNIDSESHLLLKSGQVIARKS